MKTIVKRLARDEKGASLVMVLILLLISGLIIGPLLSYMGTGLITGEVYERRTAELYAADAGVEDAIWKIQHPGEAGYLPCSPGNPPRVYTITDINGKSVQVTIEYQDGGSFKITSIAATDDGGGTAAITGTQIDAYITPLSSNYTGILDNVITSRNDIDYPNNPSQYDITYPEGHGPVEYYGGLWPTPEDLAQFYWEDVKDATHYYGDTEIDLKGNSCPPGPIYINDEENNSWPSGLGPLSINGTLDITNSKTTDPPPTLTLTGTVYITGDTLIKPNKEMTLDLNGQTIFVESSTVGTPALWIGGGKITILGPGCIIAVGDVYFEPNIPVGMTDPIFIMSVSGETLLQPGGDFYGAIAGSVEVDLQPGTSLNYPEAGFGDDINFPGFGEPTQLVYSIYSWDVIPLWRE